MQETGVHNGAFGADKFGLKNLKGVHWNYGAADIRQALAPFVHRNALLAAGKATKHRPIAAKTTRKRKQSETVSRCGICIR